MLGFGGIIGGKEREDAEALKLMRNTLRIFGGEDWRADLYGGVSFLIGGFDGPLKACRKNGEMIYLMFEGSLSNGKILSDMYCGSANKSDGEIFLAGYAEDGIEFICRAEGSFALALYDASVKRALLFRQGQGAEIFYSSRDGRTVFSTAFAAVSKLLGNKGIFCVSQGEAVAISTDISRYSQ